MAAREWSRFAPSSVLLIAGAGLSIASSVSGSALHAGSGMRVGCGEAVGVARIAESSLQIGIEVFVGNGGSLVAANADDGLLWVKVGVGIVPRHAITIRMLSPRPSARAEAQRLCLRRGLRRARRVVRQAPGDREWPHRAGQLQHPGPAIGPGSEVSLSRSGQAQPNPLRAGGSTSGLRGRPAVGTGVL